MHKLKYLSALLLLASSFVCNAQSGYRGMFNAGWIFTENASFEAITIHGYQFNPHLFVGGGAGINYYSSSDGHDAGFIPIFADVRGYLLKGKISPYAETKIGALVPYAEGGTSLYFAPEIGCKFHTSKKFALTVGVEFILKDTKDISSRDLGYSRYIDTGGLSAKIGIEF